MDRDRARRLVDRLMAAQGAFYAGGPGEELRALLADDVAWHVPGRNAIAGRYEGREAVMAYFARRRDHAARTFRMHHRDLLVGEGGHVAALTDGTAVLGGREVRWSTVGLYRFDEDLLAECHLLPLDAARFDELWR